MRPTRLTGLSALVVAAALGLTACGGSSPPSTAPPQSAPAAIAGVTGSTAAAQVVITSFSYQVAGPVQPATTVTVRNDDNVAHTVTSDTAGEFDVTVPAHGTASFTAPQTAGSYPLHCTFHPNMHGKLVVR